MKFIVKRDKKRPLKYNNYNLRKKRKKLKRIQIKNK